MRPPVVAGGRMAGLRLVAVAGQRQAARFVPGRPDYARVPRDRLPVDLFQQAEARTLGPLPAARPQAAPQTHGAQGVAVPDPRTGLHLAAPAGGGRQERVRPLGGRRRGRRRMRPAHRGRTQDPLPHGRRRPGQNRRRERRDAAGDVLPAAGRRAPASRTTTAPSSPAAHPPRHSPTSC